MQSRRCLVVLVCLLVVSLPASVGAVGDHAPADPAVKTDGDAPGGTVGAVDRGTLASVDDVSASGDVLHRTTVLRHLPDRPGEFETTMTFHVPEAVTTLEITLEPGASVEATDGFERVDDGSYRWTETTDEPTIRFTMPTDRTGDGHHESAAVSQDDRRMQDGDGYTFADAGDWAVVQVPGVGLSFSYRQGEAVGIDETVRVDGPGATGGDVAYFGPVTEYEAASDRERLRLAVAADATLDESPDEILETLVAASDRLDVGASHEEVFVVAVPADDVEWAARGVQYGESDAWVAADAPLEEAPTVWLHEYVHVRQAFANPDVGTTAETEWLVEAQAEYYAALLALEQGLIDFDAFAAVLERGADDRYADAVLAEPATWPDDRTDYVNGPLVYGEIDRQLRLATDGDRTLEDVFRTLNAADGPVTEADFLSAVEAEGGADVRATAEAYTRTDRTPSTWSRTAHETAFDRPVAQFEYAIDAASIAVAGDPWAHGGTTDAVDEVAVPAGESVTIPVTATNTGERHGTADPTLEVDGAVVDHRQVDLAAGDRATETLSWTPSEPGTYDVRVGADRLTVHVRSPASVTVTDLTIEPSDADPGDEVTATATVAAADDRPGAAVLAFRTPEGTAAEEPVAVGPGDREEVSTTLTFEEAGRFEVAVGDATAEVAVGSGPIDGVEELPGFGAVAVLVAIALAVATGLVRRP